MGKKIALVTGASSGMGRETAIQLWERFGGLDEIWAVARRGERLEELKQLVGARVRPFALDLTKEGALQVLAAALEQEKPQVRFLVNASGFGKIGRADELELRDETEMVRLNCEALTAVTRLALPYMPQGSRILQFASSAAFLPQPGFAVYAATKAFVLSYSRALNGELKLRGIRVTAVCPGPVRTEFFGVAEETGTIPFYKCLVMARPQRVVRAAIRDSVAGRELSVYGWSMKAFRLLCKLLPHSLLLTLMERMECRPESRKTKREAARCR